MKVVQIRNVPHNLTTMLFAVVAVLLTACAAPDDSWQKISTDGLIRIGLDPSFPPFDATDGTQTYGIDVDLGEALASELDIEAQFIHFGYDGLYDALFSDQVDVLISALVVFPEKTKDFSYSQPYFNAGQLLIFPAGSPIRDLNSLENQTIAVELGAEGHLLAIGWERQNPNLVILPFNSTDDALNSLVEDHSDAAVVDSISANLFIKEYNIPMDTLAVSDEPYAMVVRARDEALLEKVNEALSRIKASGDLDAIIERWLYQ